MLRFAALVLLAAPLFATDASITSLAQITAVAAGNGGMVACQHTTNPWCVFNNSTQTGQYEFYSVQISSTTGQALGSVGCMTCTNEPTLIGLANGSAQWGQPSFDPTNTLLTAWVSNPSFSTGNPGNGIGGDAWVFNFSSGVMTNQNSGCSIGTPAACLPNANITQVASNTFGVLYSYLDGAHLWMSYRWAAAAGGSAALGKWQVREFAYGVSGGNLVIGAENTTVGNASKTAFPAAYMELGHAYDPQTKRIFVQVAPGDTTGTAGNNIWNNELVAFGLDGTYDVVVATTNSAGYLHWHEHPAIDPSGTLLLFSDSANATATAYNDGMITGFVSVPLDRHLRLLTHSLCVVGNVPACVHVGSDQHDIQLTFTNATGSVTNSGCTGCSQDRAFQCPIQFPATSGCNSSNAQGNISIGYGDWALENFIVNLGKAAQNGTLFSVFITLGSRFF